MIRNTLYSLFLHFLLILLIYANFNLKTVVEPKTNEISISLIEIDATKNASKTEKIEEVPVKKQKKVKPKKDPDEVLDKPLPEIKKEEVKKVQEEKIEELAKEITEKKKEEKSKEKEPVKEVVEKKKEEKPKEVEVKKEPKKKEEEKPKPIETQKPQKEATKQEEDNKDDKEDKSVNNLENIDLSVREKFNIQSQLKACYKRALVESGTKDDKIRITITAEVTHDGFIDSNLEEIMDTERYDQEANYKITINNVRRAVELCSPLRNLPLEKYEIWKKVLLEFGEEQEN